MVLEGPNLVAMGERLIVALCNLRNLRIVIVSAHELIFAIEVTMMDETNKHKE